MKRWLLVVGFLACVGLPSSLEARGARRYPNKETTVDMSAAKNVSLGWVDLVPDNWGAYGYSSREDWSEVIHRLNRDFQGDCRTQWLSGRTIVAARDSKNEKTVSGVMQVDEWDTVIGTKDSKDESIAGQDLYIKFSDVRVNPKTYFVYLSIHFIDPKTNSEIASIPLRPYSGRLASTFERYVRTSLERVGEKIQVEVTGSPKK